MRVAIEAVGNRLGGGLAVLQRTVAALSEDSRISHLVVFCSDIERSDSPRVTWVTQSDSLADRVPWYERGFGEACRHHRADAALCLNGVGITELPRVVFIQQALAIAAGTWGLSPAMMIKMRILRRMLESACRSSAHVVVQTQWMCAQLHDRFGVHASVLPLGLIEHQGGPGAREPVVACLTGALPYKNSAVAQEAADQLVARRPEVELAFRLVESGAGFDTIRRLLSAARVCLVPSRIESFGLPLVEAFAHDCAVVAADRPYARDVCDNAALYFDADDASAAAARLEELLTDEVLRLDLVRRGRDRLQNLWSTRPYAGLVDRLEEAR